MLGFLIPIFVVIFITIFSVGGGNILKNVGSSFPDLRSYFFLPKTSDQKEQKQAPAPSAIRKAPTPTTPSFILDTVITTGPKEKESIADIKPTFGFSGSVNPTSTQGSILFESKLQGVDTDWVTTQSTRSLFF